VVFQIYTKSRQISLSLVYIGQIYYMKLNSNLINFLKSDSVLKKLVHNKKYRPH